MFKSIEQALKYLVDQKIEMVDLTFIDLIGRWRHVTIPARTFGEEVFKSGVAFDPSSVPGYKSSQRGDMVVVPDIETGRIEPFSEIKTLSFICDICEAGTLEAFDRDPRTILKKAEKYLLSSGIADGCKFSPEFEFYIFDRVRFHNEVNYSQYYITSDEIEWSASDYDGDDNTFKIPHQGGYHSMPPRDRYYALRSEITRYMIENGVEVKYHHHEVGAPGQVEIEVWFMEPLVAADKVMITKYITQMTAKKHGKTVTYMPKPLNETAGSGMHFHQFLHKKGKSLFYQKGNYANLSNLALNYIGGLLFHTPAVMAFTNPSTNSYKRLVPGFEAPTRLFFGLANRSACIRIPKYDDNNLLKRIEFRPGDGSANIYLSIAAQLLAGLEGINKKIDPIKNNFGPIDVDVQKLTAKGKAKIKSVPKGLEEALEALDSDRGFLTASGVFTDDLIDTWIKFKLENEFYKIRNRPHPYEFELYFDL